jgi:hypothetical protein
MAELRQYDPTQVVGAWVTPTGATDILDGAIDGEFVTETLDSPDWVREHDQAGNATRTRVHNSGGTIAVTLSASSPTNAALSAKRQNDVINAVEVGTLVLRDLNGTTVLTFTGAYIQGRPAVTFGSERGQRVWVFEYASATAFIGGHDLAG